MDCFNRILKTIHVGLGTNINIDVFSFQFSDF